MGLLFSVKCAKPGGSFNTSEIVRRIFSTPWGAGSWGSVCILGLEARPCAPLRPTAPHAVWPTGQQGSLDEENPDAAWPLQTEAGRGLEKRRGLDAQKAATTIPERQDPASRNLTRERRAERPY